MKQQTKLTGLFRGLTVTLASVLTLCVGLSVGAFANETDINENLNTVSRKRVIDDPATVNYPSDYDSWEEMVEAKHENIKDTMSEGIVLLKNDGVLPLASTVNKLNIFGRNSADPVYGGGAGAGQVTDENCVDVKTAFEDYGGVDINDTLYDFYATSTATARGVPFFITGEGVYTTGEIDPDDFTDAVKNSVADYGDTAIIWLARCIGEGTDPTAESKFLELQTEEKDLISYVEGLSTVSKIIVVLNEDNVMGIGDLAKDDKIDAILHVGGMGINGSEALVDILYGKTNPSGHLTDTYASSSLSSPAAQNMGDHEFDNADAINSYIGGSGEKATNYIAEEEGIYIGYRYYETRYEDSVLDAEGTGATGNYGIFYGTGDTWSYTDEVSYPFGYGLSYTSFEQTLNSVNIASDGTITASVTVTNTGKFAGKSVVELYAQAPYTEYDKTYGVEKSAVQLMGFAKTNTLAAADSNGENGGSETVTVTASMEFLASYDYTNAKTYILDDGDYYFAIGNDAHDALNNILAQKAIDNSTTYILSNPLGEPVTEGETVSGNANLVVKKTLDEIEGVSSGDTNNNLTSYTIGTESYSIDKTTWSKSTETGVEITNLFDDADYNNSVLNNTNKITYVTRSDWSTFPETEDDLTASTEMMKLLSGQASISGVDYTGGDYDDVTSVETDANNGKTFDEMFMTGYGDEGWDELLANMNWSEMASLTEGNSLTRSIPSINYNGSIDGDGPAGFSGTYDTSSTLTARVYQSECTLASTWNQDLAYAEGRFMGEDGYYLGKTSIWAPGQNLHRTPYSARNFEYYSEDSMMAYYMGAQQSLGIQDMGCIACPKHFAFNDQETHRGSLVTLINEQEARELQLRCFQGSFTKGGAMGTMTSYTRIGCVYVGASHALLTDLLRDEWGFKGYTISDYASFDFMHAVECVEAGTDMFDTTETTYSSVILKACQDGDVKCQAALREANKRVLRAYANSNYTNGELVRVWPWWESSIVALDVVIGVLTLAAAAVYIVFYVKSRKD